MTIRAHKTTVQDSAGHLSLPRTVARTFVQDLAGSETESDSRCLARKLWYSRGRTNQEDEHHGMNELTYCFALLYQTQHISEALQQVGVDHVTIRQGSGTGAVLGCAKAATEASDRIYVVFCSRRDLTMICSHWRELFGLMWCRSQARVRR